SHYHQSDVECPPGACFWRSGRCPGPVGSPPSLHQPDPRPMGLHHQPRHVLRWPQET
ncbi:unnamed protein product, partial [Candidula unifasciata]